MKYTTSSLLDRLVPDYEFRVMDDERLQFKNDNNILSLIGPSLFGNISSEFYFQDLINILSNNNPNSTIQDLRNFTLLKNTRGLLLINSFDGDIQPKGLLVFLVTLDLNNQRFCLYNLIKLSHEINTLFSESKLWEGFEQAVDLNRAKIQHKNLPSAFKSLLPFYLISNSARSGWFKLKAKIQYELGEFLHYFNYSSYGITKTTGRNMVSKSLNNLNSELCDMDLTKRPVVSVESNSLSENYFYIIK